MVKNESYNSTVGSDPLKPYEYNLIGTALVIIGRNFCRRSTAVFLLFFFLFLKAGTGLTLNSYVIYKLFNQQKREWVKVNLAVANMCLILMVFPFSTYSNFNHG
jgi:hypothetical protein